jgi:hypothetical protein
VHRRDHGLGQMAGRCRGRPQIRMRPAANDLSGGRPNVDLDLQSVPRSFGIGTRSRIIEWRMFLSANRCHLRRNMR